MKTKEEYLWEEVKELALTKFCCESPGFYQIFQMAFSNFQKSSMVGTDGETFFYEPKFFLQLYMEKGIKGINRFFFSYAVSFIVRTSEREYRNFISVELSL